MSDRPNPIDAGIDPFGEDETVMNVSLPRELDEWVQSRADEIGVEPELIIQQIVDSHRMAAHEEFEGAEGTTDLDRAVLEAAVQRQLDEWVKEDFDDTLENQLEEREWVSGDLLEHVDDRIEAQFQEWLTEELDVRIDAAVERAVEKQVELQLAEELDERDAEIESRIDSLADDHFEKITDLRERVIQVKRETDAKASATELSATQERIEQLLDTIDSVQKSLGELADRLEATESELEDADALADRIADLEAEFEEATDRLNTLGWHVSNLNDRSAAAEELEQLRQRAAELDINRAKCQHCSEAVDLGLLTKPVCPHCGSRVDGVEPGRSFWGKPRLLTVAS